MTDNNLHRSPDARRMTFDEMASRAQYEWDRAEKAEAEARAMSDCALRAEQERDGLRSFTQELSDALLTCRPLGGSELFVSRFGHNYADPAYCKAAIQQRIEAYHEAMKESVRNRKRAEKAEQERDEAYERAAKLCDEMGALEQSNFGLDRAAQNYFRARNAIRQLASGPASDDPMETTNG